MHLNSVQIGEHLDIIIGSFQTIDIENGKNSSGRPSRESGLNINMQSMISSHYVRRFGAASLSGYVRSDVTDHRLHWLTLIGGMMDQRICEKLLNRALCHGQQFPLVLVLANVLQSYSVLRVTSYRYQKLKTMV